MNSSGTVTTLKKLIPRRLRPAADRLDWRYRYATRQRRALPNFMIIGAQKSGTTSLFRYLCRHPQLLEGFRKEIHFFDGGIREPYENFKQGADWYRAHFPPRRRLGGRCKTFEASPVYLFNPLVPERIFDLDPGIRFIALLRNPTERALSHYFHAQRKGREPLPIDEAMAAEDGRLEPALQAADYNNQAFRHFSYKHRGLYMQQLERYCRFFPREQILTLCSERLFRDPAVVLRRVFEFVGVDADFEIKQVRRVHNSGANKTRVDPQVRADLNNFFRSHNQALYDFAGENYGWDDEPAG